MPRQTKKEAAAQAAVAASVMGGGAVLGRVAFMHSMNDLISKIDKAAPHKLARELEARIATGADKIKAAEVKYGEDYPALVEARETLAGLKAELTALHRDYIVPHHVMHMLHYLLDLNDRQAWPITGNGVISVTLPGVITMSVEVSTALPF